MPRVRGVTAASRVSACSAEAVLRVRPHDHRRRLRQFDLLDQRRPAGHVGDHFVAGPEQAQRGVEQRLLAAGRNDHLIRRVFDAVVGPVSCADAAAEFLGPGVDRVLREVGVDRGVCRRRRRAPASGSPAPRRRNRSTSTPCAFNFAASAATFIVGETPIRFVRSASIAKPSRFRARVSCRAAASRRCRARDRAPSRQARRLL